MSDVLVYGVLCPEGQEREAAYELLALAVQREYSISPLPKIEREMGGKPYFPGCTHIHFNISHSRGCALCALHGEPVGVDVERLRPAPRRLAAGMGDEAFFRLWTAREATVKREGRGWTALLQDAAPDGACVHLPKDFLPGCVACVCPSVPAAIRAVRVDVGELIGRDR